jgi:hypothetical protein
LFGGALSLGGDFRWTNGQLGENFGKISTISFLFRFNTSIDFVRSLMQNIKFLVRFYFVGGTVQPIQIPLNKISTISFLFHEALSLGSE